MNATGQARRSDALYYSSNDGINRRWLCDKVASLEAENTELREERDMYRDLVDCMVHPDIPDQLNAENAKLRELVRGLVYATDPLDRATLIANAAELGVEVD